MSRPPYQDALDLRQRLERVAGPHDEVGALPRAQRAQTLEAEDLRGRSGDRPERARVRHALTHGVARPLAQLAGVVGREGREQHGHACALEQRRGVGPRAQTVERLRRVLDGVDDHGHLSPSERVGDLPRLGRADEHDANTLSLREVENRQDVGLARDVDEQRHLTIEDRL